MKKLLKLFILTIFLSIFVSSPVFAATVIRENKVAKTAKEGILLATVNIKNATLTSQNDNIFVISFSLSNREGLQTGVKYGVRLIKDSPKGQFVADEKIYDEFLTLNPNTTLNKLIEYDAPISLNGSYILAITVSNSSGFPFGNTSLGKVNLVSTYKGVEILQDNCYLSLVGDSTNKKFNLDKNLGIKAEDTISLTCMALNSSNLDITATPSYEVHDASSFGPVISQINGDINPITFKKGEKKSFSVLLPKTSNPSIYNVKFALNDKDNKSNTININYGVQGVTATIENASLNKDFYSKGETALISTIYKFYGTKNLTSNIKISNDKNKDCSKPSLTPLASSISPKVDTSVYITSNCLNPIISITLTDENGKVVDQKEFKVKTTSSIPKEVSNSSIIYTISILIFFIIFYLYLKRRESHNIPQKKGDDEKSKITNTISINVILPFFFLIALFGLIPTNVAKADTFSDSNGDFFGTISTDSSPYFPEENIYLYGVVSFNGMMYSNLLTNVFITTSVNGEYADLGPLFGDQMDMLATPTPYPARGYFTAPSTAGIYTANLYISYNYNGTNYYDYFPVYYGVNDFPVVNPVVPVTVYAKGVTPKLTLPYSEGKNGVNITWNALTATSCTCTYYKDAGNPNASCGTGPAYAGDIGVFAYGNPLPLPKSNNTFSVSCTSGPTAPTFTSISNTDTGAGGYRYQIFQIGSVVRAGDLFTLMVYSHGVYVTAVSGDTATTIASKLTTAINNTSEAQWNDHLSAPVSGTKGFKPTASRRTDDKVSLTLNYQNQFGGSVTPIN